MNSSLFKLQLPDWIKSMVVAVIGAVLVVIQQALTTGSFSDINWQMVGGVALTTAVSYLVKNFFSTSNGAVVGLPSTASTPPDNSAPLA